MEIAFLIGLSLGFNPGDACVDALHALHTQEHMRIVATETVETTLVYTLVDMGRKKTVLLGCILVGE